MLKFLPVFLLLSIVTCGQTAVKNLQTTNPQAISEWKTFSQPDHSIQYPPTWEMDQSKQMGTSFILFAPLESAQD